MSDPIIDALGTISEYGDGDRKAYVVLPKSYYVSRIEIEDTGVSRTSEDRFIDQQADGSLAEGAVVDGEGNPIPAGGSPYAQLKVTVVEGPYEGTEYGYRFWLTPGKGANIGYVNNAARAISGKPVNTKALKEAGFDFTGLEAGDIRDAFRFYFYNLTPEQRLDFMTKWVNLTQWDGRTCVVKVGHETRERTTDDGKTYENTYNRALGFYSLTDDKKGQGFVKKVCHLQQVAEAEAAALAG